MLGWELRGALQDIKEDQSCKTKSMVPKQSVLSHAKY